MYYFKNCIIPIEDFKCMFYQSNALNFMVSASLIKVFMHLFKKFVICNGLRIECKLIGRLVGWLFSSTHEHFCVPLALTLFEISLTNKKKTIN